MHDITFQVTNTSHSDSYRECLCNPKLGPTINSSQFGHSYMEDIVVSADSMVWGYTEVKPSCTVNCKGQAIDFIFIFSYP